MDEIINFFKEWIPLLASGMAVFITLVKRKDEHKKNDQECENLESDTSDKFAGISIEFAEEARKLRTENEKLWDENRTLKRRVNVLDNQYLDLEKELQQIKKSSDNALLTMQKENQVLREYNKKLTDALVLNNVPVPEM